MRFQEQFSFQLSPKGKNADWITANNACNAFEMKIKRILWKRKWKPLIPLLVQ